MAAATNLGVPFPLSRANVMGRVYANRNLAGPAYQFDNRIANGLTMPQAIQVRGGTIGVLPFPGLGGGSVGTGRGALTILAVAILGIAAFNIWTHEFQQ